MFTHSSHSTPTPSCITASTAGGKQAEQMIRSTKTATQSTSIVRKRAHDTLEPVATLGCGQSSRLRLLLSGARVGTER
jgi:isopentenyl diphosphate isomerase/L-lactate dehydrogenase-like FMN-dependent dehydrogenase